jgi:hypothetical protein
MKFRHEIKYIISQKDYKVIKERIQHVLKRDQHYKESTYHVRSLYFDNLFDESLLTKLDGIEFRKKYRLRLYNMDPSFIRFECKLKKNEYIAKQYITINQSLAESMLSGSFQDGFLDIKKDKEINLLDYFFIKRMLYKPSILIDYHRESFVMDEANVRITFDSNLEYALSSPDLCDESLAMKSILKNQIILEVKYHGILPAFIKNLLQNEGYNRISVSKYALCRLSKQELMY